MRFVNRRYKLYYNKRNMRSHSHHIQMDFAELPTLKSDHKLIIEREFELYSRLSVYLIEFAF